MAQIIPFRALRYNQERVRLSDVVTQPYDKITPPMQAQYYDASPFNLVRIILGRSEPNDGEGHSVYTRAAASFADWRRQGVLTPDPDLEIYSYSQRFSIPGNDARVLERRGLIALGQLEDYDRGVVFRHEQTHTAPKADRLNLLRATRAHFEQLFMIYRDPAGAVDQLLASAADPDIDVADEYGVRHRVWRIRDQRIIQQVQAAMAEKQLIIADGHHRYETALNYRNERRVQAAAAASSGGATTTSNPDAPWERVMMTFVNMDAPGLVILPTHRVLHGLPNFQSGEFVRVAREFFSFEQMPGAPKGDSVMRQISSAASSTTVMAAATRDGTWILRAKPGSAASLMADLSPRQQQLDVVQLHRVLLQHVLGISEEAIRAQQNISYVRDAQVAVDRVHSGGADIAFLMNPVSVAQVRDIAFAGEVLPQKSTDFYPKLLSGLTIYALE
jgi:uncharacterized protein (DUF1015 family)